MLLARRRTAMVLYSRTENNPYQLQPKCHCYSAHHHQTETSACLLQPVSHHRESSGLGKCQTVTAGQIWQRHEAPA